LLFSCDSYKTYSPRGQSPIHAMIYSNELPTSQDTLYTIPAANPGIPNSGSNKTVNFFRIVNESAAARTFTIYLTVRGNNKAITPISTQLPIGAAYDDIPAFQLPPGSLIRGVASGADVSWTINVE